MNGSQGPGNRALQAVTHAREVKEMMEEQKLAGHQHRYLRAVEHYCKGLEGINSGNCSICPECMQYFDFHFVEPCDDCEANEKNCEANCTWYVLTSDEQFEYERQAARDAADEAQSNGDWRDDGSFSWSSCASCGSTLGGTRYAAHAWISKGAVTTLIVGNKVVKYTYEKDTLLHLDICTDCLCYHANGDLPSDEYPWEGGEPEEYVVTEASARAAGIVLDDEL